MALVDFGTHTYWRMQVFGEFVAFSAMLFKDDVGSTIATTGGTAIELNHFSTDVPANLFDSNNATSWCSLNSGNSGYNGWVGYAFATPQKVMQIGLQITSGMNGVPSNWVEFQFSDDGITWGIAGGGNTEGMVNNTPRYFDLANAL